MIAVNTCFVFWLPGSVTERYETQAQIKIKGANQTRSKLKWIMFLL